MTNSCPITCVICAYETSSYLEECIRSLLNQTVHPHILISTSTPNNFVTSIAKKYNLPLFINSGKADMQDNWNFAYAQAQTPYVTICHQDDYYEPTYIETLLKPILKDKENKILLLHTRWKVLKGTHKKQNICSVIHFGLNLFASFFPSNKWIRKRALSFGNSIKTPSVCYNKTKLAGPLFTSSYQYACDWDTFLKLTDLVGNFVYISKPVFLYRISSEALSNVYIHNNQRAKEDFKIFCTCWPKSIATILAKIYTITYSVYK